MKKLLTLAFSFVLFSHLHSQSFWERSHGPNGLNVSKLYYSPQGEVYSTDFNDRTYRSLNNGLSWEEIFGPEPGIEIRKLKVGYNGTLFCVGSDWITKYRSTDYGDTWAAMSIPENVYVYTEAADGAFLALTESGILRSFDFTDWDTLMPNLASWFLDQDNLDIGWLPNGTLVATNQKCYNQFSGQYFLISKDNGLLWDSLPGAGNISRMGYLGNDTYIFSNKSFCSTVYKTSLGSSVATPFLEDMLNTVDHQYLISPTGALIVSNCDSTRISYDAGLTWQSHEGDMCLARTNQTLPGNLVLGGRNYAGHLMRTPDEGRHWSFSGYGIEHAWFFDLTFKNADLAFALSSAGIWRTQDGGQTWHIVPYDQVSRHAEIDVYNLQIAPNGDLYVCRPRVLLRSTDDGETFQELGPALPGLHFTRVSVQPGTGEVFLTTDAGLFKSSDQGQSWQLWSTQNLLYPTPLAFHPNGDIYCVSFDTMQSTYLLLRSEDGGINWQNIPSLPGPFQTINQVQIMPDGKILASNSCALFVSTDNGTTWTKRNAPNCNIYSTAINAAGHLFYSDINSKKIYKTEDDGLSWTPLENLPSSLYTGIVHLAIDPSQRLWVCTDGDGYFRTVGPTVAVQQPLGQTPELSIYPNPAQGGFWLKTGLDEASKTYSIQLRDLTGRLVFSREQQQSFVAVPERYHGLYLVECRQEGLLIGIGKIFLE
jgi:photosystem II stability/assembly factor-like uncharacterized protein